MTGNTLQIFSIMMVFMMFKSPIQSIMNVQAAFQRFESEGTKARILTVKIVYVLMNMMLLGLGVYKINAMGLLPYVYPGISVSMRADNLAGHRDRTGWLGRQNEIIWNGHTLRPGADRLTSMTVYTVYFMYNLLCWAGRSKLDLLLTQLRYRFRFSSSLKFLTSWPSASPSRRASGLSHTLRPPHS